MNKLKYRLLIKTKLKGLWRSLLLRLLMNKSQWKAYKSWMSHANPDRLGEMISLDYNQYNECYYIYLHEIYEQATSSTKYPIKNYKLNLDFSPEEVSQ